MPDKRSEWVADIEFVFSECARINNLIDKVGLLQIGQYLTQADLFSELPHPSGHGHIICGFEARRRLQKLAARALEFSDAAGTVTTNRVLNNLQELIVQRFARDGRPLVAGEVDSVLSRAVNKSKKARFDARHFIPCRLMTTGPSSFQIGPILFRSSETFEQFMAPIFSEHLNKEDASKREDLEFFVNTARQYYAGFTWVAEVLIPNCDETISRLRAEWAVRAALDCLHLLFGQEHSSGMAIAGPRLGIDTRAHVHIGARDELQISLSDNPTSEVGFEKGWEASFAEPDVSPLVNAFGSAIETVINPIVQRPLGRRIVDAVGWFGDGVRDKSPAASIVKCITAVERLILPIKLEGDTLTKTFAKRAAAFCFDDEKNIDTFEQEFASLYDLRSQLAHGAMSPFHPEVIESHSLLLDRVGTVLRNGIGFFYFQNILDKKIKDKELDAVLERLTARFFRRSTIVSQ